MQMCRHKEPIYPGLHNTAFIYMISQATSVAMATAVNEYVQLLEIYCQKSDYQIKIDYQMIL